MSSRAQRGICSCLCFVAHGFSRDTIIPRSHPTSRRLSRRPIFHSALKTVHSLPLELLLGAPILVANAQHTDRNHRPPALAFLDDVHRSLAFERVASVPLAGFERRKHADL